MPIASSRYVKIVSSVGGANQAPTRQLIMRVFTTNPLVPTKGFLEFTNSNDVATFFGSASIEYLRAVRYFGFITKGRASSPPKISFARWVNTAAAPMIYGASGTQTVAAWTPITNGSITLGLGTSGAQLIGSLNFSSAQSLSDVASILQTAIRAKTGTVYTQATVTYDPIFKRFVLTGGATGTANPVTIAAGTTGVDVAAQLGWLSPTAIISQGSDVETLTQTLINTASKSNNFGSFLFIPYLTPTQNLEVGQWTDAQNVAFAFLAWTTAADAAANNSNLIPLSGNVITLSPITTDYPEQLPGEIMAATDYNGVDTTQNYMYQQDPCTPSVTNDTDANTYDALRINYYGVTQTAGNMLAFYQRGVMCGNANDPVDINTFANEMWFKDDAGTGFINLLLALAKVSANTVGRAQLSATIQASVNKALTNGTISPGKELTVQEVLDIGQITGDPRAYKQIAGIGYWYDVSFSSTVTTDGRTERNAVYALVYSKDDCIRSVLGSHTLI